MKRFYSLLLVFAVVMSLFAGWSSRQHVDAADPRWVCEARPFTVGNRVDKWAGDTGGAGTAFPDGMLAVVGSDVSARVFHVWLYSAAGGDYIFDVPYSILQPEPGTVFPTGRFDPMGVPVVLLDRGMLKILVREWNGGGNGPAPLARIYTWCWVR